MKQQTLIISDTQAETLASALRPYVRDFIDMHREEYNEFLTRWRERQKKEKEGGA